MMLDIILDLIPYFLLVGVLIIPLLVSTSRGKNKRYFWFCVVAITAFSAFRYGVGWDYFNYCNAIRANDWQVERMEPLMRWLATYSNRINSPHFFIFVTSVATVLLYAVVIYKKSLNPTVSLLVFLCLPFLFLSGISIVRFALAVAIVFYASLYYKKPIIYVALVIAAFMTHRGAILGLLVWPFLGPIRVSLRWNWIICIIGLLVSFMPSIMAPIFSGFINLFTGVEFLDESVGAANRYLEVVSGSGFTRLPYVYAIINLVNLFSYKELTRRNPNTDVNSLITLYNVGTSIMLFLSFDSVFASRLGQLFMVNIVLLVPYYLTLRSKNTFWGVILVVVALFFLQLLIPGYHDDFIGRWNCFLPYKTIFSSGVTF